MVSDVCIFLVCGTVFPLCAVISQHMGYVTAILDAVQKPVWVDVGNHVK
jgi:hypothetical protein